MPRSANRFACALAWLTGSCEMPGMVAIGLGVSSAALKNIG